MSFAARKIITRLSASKEKLNVNAAIIATATLSNSNKIITRSAAKLSNTKLKVSSDKPIAITKKVQKTKSNSHVHHSNNLKKEKIFHSDDSKKEKHRLVEAKGRAKRIQLYEELNFAIRNLEKKFGVTIPSNVKIINEDLVDDRRKITKRNDKYNNEDILRKVFVMQHIALQITKKREKKQQQQQQAESSDEIESVSTDQDEQVDEDDDEIVEPKDMDLDSNTCTTTTTTIDEKCKLESNSI